MNWNDLETFLAVYRDGTYAGAARSLKINPTTVARRMERLSRDIGAVLFQSTSDGLLPTPAAESILSGGEAMERQVTLIERRISGDEARLTGAVRVAASPEFATYFLVDHIPRLREIYPQLEIQLAIGNAFSNLSRGDADLAVRFSAEPFVPLSDDEPAEAVLSRLLGPVSIHMVASREYLERRGNPGESGSLAGHDLLLQPGAQYLPGMSYLSQFEKDAHVALRCDSLSALIAAAARGVGITAGPSFVLKHYPELVIIRRDISMRQTWLLMARDLRRVARVRVVRDFIVELWVRSGDEWGLHD